MDVTDDVGLDAIVELRKQFFVLWRLGLPDPPPALVIGRLQAGAPVGLADERQLKLERSAEFPDLWTIAAAECGLVDDEVYHYWFEVTDAHPGRPGARVRITDPIAYMVDWRLRAPQPPGSAYTGDDRYPAGVVKYRGGELVACDAGGEVGTLDPPAWDALPANNRVVIYEMPTAWARISSGGVHERAVGTFRDVRALVDDAADGANFRGLTATTRGRSYLADELGINALQLLPPADSSLIREWGYGTTNFLAPDFELGFPSDSAHPTPNRDLRDLVSACHDHGMRFFVDVVMAFARNSPYLAAATDDFFILDPAANPADPDAHDSRGGLRNAFGSTLFRYETFHTGYDPLTGTTRSLSPAARLMQIALVRWMTDFQVDGLRLDSVENVFSWNFIGAYRDLTHHISRTRLSEGTADAHVMVVGEELQEPLEILRQHRLDGLWHDSFKRHIRAALLGRGEDGRDLAQTIRAAIDCRAFGYTDLAQAVIYLTSHDVEGYRNERLFNFLRSNGVADCEKRIKLAFACLLTAVGIPQILAGDEFADEHDLFDENGHVTQSGGKQVDPVNYSRLDDDWRTRIKDYVARLVKFRTRSDALASNDVEFIHVDLDGKTVLAWRRGDPGSGPVVVVANFSDYATPPGSSAEYVVHNWPGAPPGGAWREVSQDRDVPPEWVGREPIFPWEAKVYALTDGTPA